MPLPSGFHSEQDSDRSSRFANALAGREIVRHDVPRNFEKETLHERSDLGVGRSPVTSDRRIDGLIQMALVSRKTTPMNLIIASG